MNDYLSAVKILIVEDQLFIRAMIHQLLGAFGARDIHDASDGKEAWEKMSVIEPDIIIVDWEMTPVNGLQFTRRIRTDPESPNPYIPIIMLSGHSEVSRVNKARDAGVTEFVVKPIAAKSLFNRIVNVINRPRSFIKIGKYFGPDRRRHSIIYPEERRGVKKGDDGSPAEDTETPISGARVMRHK
jgi:two-component system, chemotaxis family, chemotaxis protein CheY